ncbi:glycosyltransferase family 4 protein [Leisingera aquaemixtae]|uniref:glycosyltransferase family 4 protein n=1 Tax=Leisingera aquaemixtae TaxID=1396826 RepID=UPI001C97E16A|nr:glycosyltransferase family 4 protein [Leisingera aquaemixtae]MBY6069558.1 glycosyltransferase family 4 protein [Leisingera aquaemixtae]
MSLAIATQNPDAVAETYVRQHMRLVRPGQTVGIGLACAQPPAAAIPFHCVRLQGQPKRNRLGTVARFLRTGYRASLSRREEAGLGAFLQAHGTTAVLAEFGTTGCALRVFCRQAGLPLFVNFHGHDATVLGRRRDMRFAYRMLAQSAQGFFCGSRHFAGVLEGIGIPGRKITVIPCGIEVGEFSADTRKDPGLVIAVGRLTRKKRPDLAIRAFARARREHPSLRLEIIGDGPEKKACRAVIGELGLEAAVTMLGACSHDEVKARLAGAAVFIQHSVTADNGDQESQGISLLEAMASGAAVAVTDHNGFSETVKQGETGFLSPERDVEAMAASILRLAREPALARKLGQAGRARVEEYFDAHRLARQLRQAIFGGEAPAACPQPGQLEAGT